MAQIRTFTVDWPHLPQKPRLSLAIGHSRIPTQWFLLHPREIDDAREWSGISIIPRDDPAPRAMPNGNPVIGLKNYTENDGLLGRLEELGVVRQTGVVHKQAMIQIPMVEVLVPEEEQIHVCSNEECGNWEDVDKPRFSRCSKCKKTYYCSPECQRADWTEHKAICKDILRGDNLAVLNRERAAQSQILADMGFNTVVNLGGQNQVY